MPLVRVSSRAVICTSNLAESCGKLTESCSNLAVPVMPRSLSRATVKKGGVSLKVKKTALNAPAASGFASIWRRVQGGPHEPTQANRIKGTFRDLYRNGHVAAFPAGS